MPRNCTPRSLYCCHTPCRIPCSFLHGPHHVAQKFTTSTLPAYSEAEMLPPSGCSDGPETCGNGFETVETPSVDSPSLPVHATSASSTNGTNARTILPFAERRAGGLPAFRGVIRP